MTARRSTLSLCLLLTLGTSACQLLDTASSENVSGRGAKAFDPYGSASGARRLVLQQFRGCAINASGAAVGPGTAKIPYPATCADINYLPFNPDPTAPWPEAPPMGKYEVVAGSKYFLNQLTLHDQVEYGDGDQARVDAALNDTAAPLYWMKTKSKFKSLDWSLASVQRQRWIPDFSDPHLFFRQTTYDGAAWQNDQESSFLVEVLDSDGTVRTSETYLRKEFLAENRVSGHVALDHTIGLLGKPTSPADQTAHMPVGLALVRTTVKIEFYASTNPFKQIAMPDIEGDGAVRVTWSSMPNEPFYFPVTFVRQASLPTSCYSSKDGTTPVQCSSGINPTAELSRPKNGKFFEPGESLSVRFQLRDGDGNLLHERDQLNSFSDSFMEKNNGLLEFNFGRFFNLLEEDNEAVWQILGPIQDSSHFEQFNTERPPYTQFPEKLSGLTGVGQLIPTAGQPGTLVGGENIRWSTVQPVDIPPGAKPGTYALYLKIGRHALGERITKGNVVYFQVGQAEQTQYPGRVGNCQICHRGVLSLDNLRHGFSVDHIEGCKACHKTNYYNFSRDVHLIHMDSVKYPFPKNQCTVCHLVKESAIRSNIEVCSACHPAVHGVEFFGQQFELYGSPNRFTECAGACHKQTTPTQHILPAN